VLAILVIATGCYRPEVARCNLLCADNDACPDGLACNMNGVCASSPSDTCDDVPIDDGSMDTIDTPPPAMSTVTIDVLALDNAPLVGVPVLFTTTTGVMIDQINTDDMGRVVTTIPTGSAATILRDPNASTYLDLWPDAHITSRFSEPTNGNSVGIVWSSQGGGATSYSTYGSCFTNLQNTTLVSTSINIPVRCATADLFVIALNSSNLMVSAAGAANVANTSGTTSITNSSWGPIGTIDIDLMNPPNGTNEIKLSPYLTPKLAYTTSIASPSVPSDGKVGLVSYPTQFGVTMEISNSTMLGTGDTTRQLFVERMPAQTTAYAKNLRTIQFPVAGKATLDAATGTMSWAFIDPGIAPTAVPTIAFAKISFRRSGMPHEWHVIGRADHITRLQNQASFQLPMLPGNPDFVPTVSGITLLNESMYIFRTNATSEDAVRATIESHEDNLDLFDVPGLTSILRTVAP
jgi:hypothetical protein